MAIRMRDGDQIVTTYEGAVLATGERNGYHDSDFYAVVYDAETDEVKSVEYGTTRFWTYDNSAAVDADEATVEAALASIRRRAEEGVRSEVGALNAQIDKGCRVRFLRAYSARKIGRRIEEGDEATCFWYGQDNYRRYAYRAGVELADGERIFLDAAVIARCDIEELDEREVTNRLDRIVANNRYRWTGRYAREAVTA